MSKLGVGLIILVFFVYQAALVDMVDQLIKHQLQPQQWFCYSVISMCWFLLFLQLVVKWGF